MTADASAKKQKKSLLLRKAREEQMNARRTVIEELFNDLYEDRRNIYAMNFFRGIFFGIGSVLGGTIIIGVIIWVLSFFVQLPFIGPTLQQAQDEIRNSQEK